MITEVLIMIGGGLLLTANLPISMNVITRMFSAIFGVILALIGLFFI